MSFVSVNGVRLNVVEMPQRSRRRKPGLPIVLVHGLAASSAFWYAAGAPALSLLGPCMAYDLRGHGKSARPDSGYSVTDMAQDLEALMDDRGIERADLVAHSFGGMVTLLFALRHPERVRSLVLVDVRVRPLQATVDVKLPRVPPGVARRLEALGFDLEALARADDGMDYLNFVARIQLEAGPEEAAGLLKALYRHSLLFRTPKAARRWIELTERASLVADIQGDDPFDRADLRRLQQPVLTLVGGRSTTLASARGLARICPQATLKVVPDVGHFFPVSKPKLFLQPTLRFLHAVARNEADG
ncbi:alpha/beta fold hydrolase [Shimia sp.]|uniref:alpha/beta fold hydrolase n=1 Tax=Shimia sp. TaxID=1954381 RepID=UPI003565BE99